MGKYSVRISPIAEKELKAVHKSGDKGSIKKIEKLIDELSEHPKTGTGKPEQLKGVENIWSKENRQEKQIALHNKGRDNRCSCPFCIGTL